ncbi:MAG: NifB/NifX family molybdenum-iron cluster-binding protein [Nitrososphaerota archaeon]|nr:NifB/NifX family molybdenum-iron cluster-binding protein [Nitrososphaerota archaeon]MDG6927069.1 NifB/NifX family molybdenum-iron cluster-binding protein [Nitrososphaerota archaeon]MDG6930569.1 NifB/NifX family molybdenum-iron cluster-binding protein [Nitrososphaerota archaeon]MDG6932364.1 NifB/NifX family molybdenum-iron cluster-binding protein [Nitrososphaerota archaeon]MDG6935923.1 NifB/NifX family molybdenum-iron cluster-binding protein [Nitrososphaerota archaeon]
MILAFPVEDDEGLDSKISMHFGRAKYFAFVKVEGDKIANFEVKQNPHAEHEAGDLPKFVRENGAEFIIAYGMGPRAVDFFKSFGVQVITGASGKVKEVTGAIIKNSLTVDDLWKEHGDFEHHPME